MTESPYAIPVEELEAGAHVPLAEQVEEQSERRFFGGDSSGLLPWADGMAGDVDGE
jgi:hypothetical protein